MRRRDKSFAPKNDPLAEREPGVLPLASTAAADAAPPAADDEPKVVPGALAVPETDPEKIAFAMWNEGRIDEAIEFLQGQISVERDRRRETALVPAGGPGEDEVRVVPATDWRERHRSALAKGDFNAFGATIHTVDIKATPADAIVAHPPRRSRRAGWLMGVAVAVIGISAAAAYLKGGDDFAELAALPSALPAQTEPAATPEPVSVAAKPEMEIATVEPSDVAASVTPSEAADAKPPEVADLPPESEPVEETASTPVDEPPDEAIADNADLGASPDDASAPAPQTTASIAPAPEQTPILEPRLPRQRPEPPASFTQTAAAEAAPDPLVIPEPDVPLVVSEPEVRVIGGPEFPALYAEVPRQPNRPLRPVRRLLPGIGPVYDSSYPATLTPAEYQALLERRAWAQRYSAERRTRAEGRITFLP